MKLTIFEDTIFNIMNDDQPEWADDDLWKSFLHSQIKKFRESDNPPTFGEAENIGLCDNCNGLTVRDYSHTIRGYRDSMGAPEEPDEEVYVCSECYECC